MNAQYVNPNLTSVPIAQGGMSLDQGLSDFDRRHRLTILYLWEIPGPSRGFWKPVVGGWSIAGITTFQSGTPYTVINGFDRNGDGWPEDRPDISDPTRRSAAELSSGPRLERRHAGPATATRILTLAPLRRTSIGLKVGIPELVHRWPEHVIHQRHEEFRRKPYEDYSHCRACEPGVSVRGSECS